ncbi:MAG: RNA-binding protein [bacterium]|nr:RNA-binding protein [bacterium]
MENKLFVGGIPFQLSEEELQAAFAQAGEVTSVRIIVDKMTGRSRGFGFVEMSSSEQAKAAMEMWDGKELEGRQIAVKEAKAREE